MLEDPKSNTKNGAAIMVPMRTAKWPSESFGIDLPKTEYHLPGRKSSKTCTEFLFLCHSYISLRSFFLVFSICIRQKHVCPCPRQIVVFRTTYPLCHSERSRKMGNIFLRSRRIRSPFGGMTDPSTPLRSAQDDRLDGASHFKPQFIFPLRFPENCAIIKQNHFGGAP